MNNELYIERSKVREIVIGHNAATQAVLSKIDALPIFTAEDFSGVAQCALDRKKLIDTIRNAYFHNPHGDWDAVADAVLTIVPAQCALREALVSVTASLAAAISLLERTPKAKKAAPSDKMFEQMLIDYRKSLETGRAALTSTECGGSSDEK